MRRRRKGRSIAAALLCIGILAAGCNHLDTSPSGATTFPYNETFALTYSADLKPSSPTSFTAKFSGRDLHTEDHAIKLASITNATVTLIQSTDSSGAPVWRETFELFVQANGYRTVPFQPNPSQIAFGSAVRNEAGGPIDRDTKTQSAEVTCSGSIRFVGQRDLSWNPIGPGFKATIDISSTQWKKC